MVKSWPNRRPRSPAMAFTTPGSLSMTNRAGLGRPALLPMSAAGLISRPDVLVDVECVVRVVAALDLGQPGVVAAVGGPDPLLALVHHEVDVRPARGLRVQLVPVVPGPAGDQAGVGRVRVHAHDDPGEAAVPVGERGRVGR